MKPLLKVTLTVLCITSLNSCARMTVNVSTADSNRIQEIGDIFRYKTLAYAYSKQDYTFFNTKKNNVFVLHILYREFERIYTS